jgi:hypothetical protein
MKPKHEMQTSHIIKCVGRIICVICGLVLFLQIGCQEQAKPSEELTAMPRPGEPSPKIEFEELTYDFGQVGPNVKQTGQFKFTNTGKALLKITKVGRCCGVVTKLDKMEYEPGESGALIVEWNSGPMESTMTRQLVVHSNDPNTPATNLTIKATVVLQIDWEPKRLKLFLDEENAGCSKITINSIDNQPFSITGFKSTADCITADYDSSIQAPKFVLEPKVDIEKLQKNLKGRIIISLSHPQGDTAIILYSVLPKYTVNPPLLIIFNAEPEKPIVRKISVLNNYGKDFEIESLSSENDVVTVKILEKTKIRNGYQLDVEITPPADEGKTRFSDLFTVNIKDGEKLLIRCNGYYIKRQTEAKTQESTLEKPDQSN